MVEGVSTGTTETSEIKAVSTKTVQYCGGAWGCEQWLSVKEFGARTDRRNPSITHQAHCKTCQPYRMGKGSATERLDHHQRGHIRRLERLAASERGESTALLIGGDGVILGEHKTGKGAGKQLLRSIKIAEQHLRLLAKQTAASKDVEERWVSTRTEDLLDTARMRAKTSDADVAFDRLITRSASRMEGILYSYSTFRDLRDDRISRRDEGLWQSALRWNPFNAERSQFTTFAFWKVRRCVQPRTKADRPIAFNSEDGSRAISLDLGGCRGGDVAVWEPVAVSATKGRRPRLSDMRDLEGGLSLDVSDAMLSLPDEVRNVAVLVYLRGYKKTETARGLGITLGAVSKRLKVAKELLRETLASYSKE